MTNARMLSELRERMRVIRQEEIKLVNTTWAIRIYQEAKLLNSPTILIDDLYLLISSMAKHEWGEETTIDDFSVEGKFVVRCGTREKII